MLTGSERDEGVAAVDKKTVTEQDIRTKYITPAIEGAGWDIQTRVREEVTLTAGRVIVRGRLVSRSKSKRADYVLYHKPNIPLAVIEAKDNKHGVGDGMQQALAYAEMMDVPFVFSSNGDAFLAHDRTLSQGPKEQEIPLSAFPSAEDLWLRYRATGTPHATSGAGLRSTDSISGLKLMSEMHLWTRRPMKMTRSTAL